MDGSKASNEGNGNSSSEIGKGCNSDPKKVGSGSGNAHGYLYPQPQEFIDGVDNQNINVTASNPIVLIDSEKTPIVAYVDEGQVKKSQNEKYLYDYTTSFTLGESPHIGLGFCDEVRTTIDGFGSSDEGDTSVKAYHAEMSHSDENPGYVLIGGNKIYTQDISNEENKGQEEEELSYYKEGSRPSEDCSGMSESDGFLRSGLAIDDEVAADYVEGNGGIGNTINVDQRVEENTDEDNFDKTVQKFGQIDVQEASREYGTKRTRLERNNCGEVTPVAYAWSSSLDDHMLVYDPRTISGKKKNVAWPQQSWPAEAHKKKHFRWVSEEMKEQRKEMNAAKRRANMLQRGVDVNKLNLKLEQIVLDGIDMYSFTPMLPRDCAMVRRLAAVYRLRFERQGSGKERIATVVRTQQTCMPSAADKIRLNKLTGADDKDVDFSVNDSKPIKGNTYTAKTNARAGPSTTPQFCWKKSSDNLATYSTSNVGNKNRTMKVRSYASQPLSFVPSGIMSTGVIESTPTELKDKLASNSVKYGGFEMHTTGFGSKMMVKMGYVEGEGLGKDGRGIAQPIEVLQRPKSLGLGAHAPKSGVPMNMPPQLKSIGHSKFSEIKLENEEHKFGSFEKHTKGLGPKMMARLGFVEGMGPGRDTQGMAKSVGLVLQGQGEQHSMFKG